MLLFVLLAVFIGGLMVGRTPEYLGKKIEAREIKLVALGRSFTPLIVLLFDRARDRRRNTAAPSIFAAGPQGFSETLYAYLSQANNNGSAFAGYTGFLQPNAPATSAPTASRSPTSSAGWRCSFGRFVPIVVVLAVAGSLAAQAGRAGRPGDACAPTRRPSSSC